MTVKSGATLTIEAGTNIIFAGGSLSIKGNLSAEGTSSKKIQITSVNPGEVSYDISVRGNATIQHANITYFENIYVAGGGHLNLVNSRVAHGATGVQVSAPGSATIRRSEFTSLSVGVGIYQGISQTDGFAAPVTIRRTRFHNLGTAIYMDGPIDESGPIKQLEVHNSVFRNVDRAIFSNRKDAGYRDILISSSIFVNAKSGIVLPGKNIVNVEITNNKFRRISKTAVNLRSSARLTAREVSVNNNIFVNNNISISLYSTHASIRRNSIGYNRKGIFLKDGVTYNVTFNNIYGNEKYGLRLAEPPEKPKVNATHNYWGAASGPTIETNPDGTGDRLVGGGTFRPFAKEPIQGVPIVSKPKTPTQTSDGGGGTTTDDGYSDPSSLTNDRTLVERVAAFAQENLLIVLGIGATIGIVTISIAILILIKIMRKILN